MENNNERLSTTNRGLDYLSPLEQINNELTGKLENTRKELFSHKQLNIQLQNKIKKLSEDLKKGITASDIDDKTKDYMVQVIEKDADIMNLKAKVESLQSIAESHKLAKIEAQTLHQKSEEEKLKLKDKWELDQDIQRLNTYFKEKQKQFNNLESQINFLLFDEIL